MQWNAALCLSLSALALSACESNYIYRPAENATATVAGRVAAIYDLPPTAPSGDLRIAAFGISKLSPERAPVGETTRAIHLRMVLANNGHAPWTLDTRDQEVDISGVGKLRPAYVSTKEGAGGLPQVIIAPGGKRTVDLFYPLPEGLQKASRIPEFDALWTVQTEAGPIVERTPFDRLLIEPVYAYDYGQYGWYPWGFGYGGFGGYGPFWVNPYFSMVGGTVPDYMQGALAAPTGYVRVRDDFRHTDHIEALQAEH